MKRRILALPAIPLVGITVLFMMLVVSSASAAQTYKVLSPWADTETVTYKGISPRLESLDNKVIGLFANEKPSSKPVLTVVEKKLKERYPDLQFIWYEPVNRYRYNWIQTETENKERFYDWLSKVDGVISASGD